jgi:hypothetical protein
MLLLSAAECPNFSNVMLSIVMLSIVMLNVVLLIVVVQSLLPASCYFISNQPKTSCGQTL